MANEYARAEVLERTTYHLLRIGFQASQKGYRYLREAVWIAYSRPETMDSVTKLLYPEIARLFATTDKQVERAIRAAVGTAWDKGELPICGEGHTRPTNKMVIEQLVGALKAPKVLRDSEED